MKATRLFAVMAVLAMVFAGTAVIAEQNDAANEPAVVCFAEGRSSAEVTDYNKMMVFGYSDKSIIINTTYMDLGKATEFIVTVADNADYSAATNKTTVGPVSAQNGKIVIDTPEAIFAANASLYVTLYDYEAPATIVSIANLTVPDNISTAIAFELYTNYLKDFKDANNFDVAHTNTVASGETGYDETKAEKPIAIEAADIIRGNSGTKITLDETTATNAFTDASGVYELKGWSIGYTENAKIDFYPGSYTIEEIIMTLADKHMLDTVTTTEPKYAPIPTATAAAADNLGVDQVAGKLILNAIYEKNTFEVILADGLDTSSHPAEGFGITDVDFPTDAPTVKASVTSKIDADSFGVLRIQQLVPAQYDYTFTIYGFDKLDATGNKTFKEDTSEVVSAKIKMVTNGVFKISEVKRDIVIKVTPTAKTSPTDFTQNGYAFQIQAIENLADTGGKVRLSLDVFDYVPYDVTNDPATALDAKDHMQIAGTYFKDLGDGIRAYGNLESSGAYAKTTNFTSKIDDAPESTADASITTVGGKVVMQLNKNDTVFDLDWTAANADIGIYAAKGIWTQNALNSGGDALEQTDVETPWSLFTATA